MKKKDSNDLNSKISKVLITYFKTQFILILVSLLAVWGIMAIVPNLHPLLEVLIVVFCYLIFSNLMDLFVAPYFLGKKTKINPILIFISFLLGITFFGVLGALLAIPIALVIKTVWDHHYKNI